MRCPDGPSHPGRPAPGQGFPSNKKLECTAMSRSQGVLKRSSWSQPISQVRNLCNREALQRPLQTSHIGIPCKHEHLNVSLTAFISGKLVLTRQTSATTWTATGNEARKCSFFSLLLQSPGERSRMKMHSPLPLEAPAVILMCLRKADQGVGAECGGE